MHARAVVQPVDARESRARTGAYREYRGRLVVNVAGAWAPKVAAMVGATVKMRPGKGVHLTLDRRLSNYGVVSTAVDGRQIFVMPHGQTSIIGTTDDDFYGDPDDLPITEDEVAYLWQAATRSVPRSADPPSSATSSSSMPERMSPMSPVSSDSAP